MGCQAEGCWGNELPGRAECLVHTSPIRRDAFLRERVDEQGGVDGLFRGLHFTTEIFETEILPVLPALDEHIDFTGCRFPGSTDFGELRFAKWVTFNGATFDWDVGFSGVTFGNDARFNGTTFLGPAIFGAGAPHYFSGTFRSTPTGAVFTGWAEFTGAQFHEDAQFDLVDFQGNVDFSRAQFRSECRLESLQQTDDPQVGRTFSFHNTRFREGIIADLPAGRVLAQGVEFGGPSRLVVRGPISLNRITLNHPLSIQTSGREDVARLAAAGCTPEVETLSGATLQAPLILGGGMSLRRCPLGGAVGLEQLGLHPATATLAVHGRRRVLYDEIAWRQTDRRVGRRLAQRFGPSWEDTARSVEPHPEYRSLDPGPIAGRYRQLRQGLEEAKNAPGAGDFYYGEMEMRRAATDNRFERAFLWLYWLVSGYGLRAWRSAAAYLAVVVAATAAFRFGSSTLLSGCAPGSTCPDLDDWWSILVFVIRWSVSLFPSPDTAGISTGGQAVLLALRFVSPVLLALTFLSIRSRVHR